RLRLTGFGGALLNGWQWNGSYLYQGGQPITPQSGADAYGNLDTAGDRVIINPNASGELGTGVSFVCRQTGTGNTIVAGTTGGCQGGTAGNPVLPAGVGGGSNYVVGYIANNPDARFVQAQPGAIANSGRNIVNSAPIDIWNMGFFKNTKIGERTTLQFRAD